MIAILSPRNIASSLSCVTKIVVASACFTISLISSLILILKAASRLDKGSSNSITVGLGTNARARAVLCCSPPESSLGILFSKLPRPTKVIIFSTRSVDLFDLSNPNSIFFSTFKCGNNA